MKIGTKSLLFGVHQVFIHPIVVAIAWIKIYGFPFDPRIWIAFVVHDWGYWGCSEMDGEEGDYHPILGAEIMHFLFDKSYKDYYFNNKVIHFKYNYWYDFCIGHSRFLSKQYGRQPSKLCMADKLLIEPWWLYLPRAWLSGELKEYMKSAQSDGKHGHMNCNKVSAKEWYQSVQAYLRKYVEEHKDGKIDNVTQVVERYSGKSGV